MIIAIYSVVNDLDPINNIVDILFYYSYVQTIVLHDWRNFECRKFSTHIHVYVTCSGETGLMRKNINFDYPYHCVRENLLYLVVFFFFLIPSCKMNFLSTVSKAWLGAPTHALHGHPKCHRAEVRISNIQYS